MVVDLQPRRARRFGLVVLILALTVATVSCAFRTISTGHVGVTVVEAIGHGRQRGITHEYRGRIFESRFLPKAVSAPVAITNHLARQLDLPPVLFGEVPERLATETDHLERILVVMNFQSAAASVTLDLSGVAAGGLTNVRTSAAVPLQTKLSVDVPAYGYELFLVSNER